MLSKQEDFDSDILSNDYNHDPHDGKTQNTPVLHYFGSHHKAELKRIVTDFMSQISDGTRLPGVARSDKGTLQELVYLNPCARFAPAVA